MRLLVCFAEASSQETACKKASAAAARRKFFFGGVPREAGEAEDPGDPGVAGGEPVALALRGGVRGDLGVMMTYFKFC